MVRGEEGFFYFFLLLLASSFPPMLLLFQNHFCFKGQFLLNLFSDPLLNQCKPFRSFPDFRCFFEFRVLSVNFTDIPFFNLPTQCQKSIFSLSSRFALLWIGGTFRRIRGRYALAYRHDRPDRFRVSRQSRCEEHDRQYKRCPHGYLFYAIHRSDHDKIDILPGVEPPAPLDGRSCTPATSWERLLAYCDTPHSLKSMDIPIDGNDGRAD